MKTLDEQSIDPKSRILGVGCPLIPALRKKEGTIVSGLMTLFGLHAAGDFSPYAIIKTNGPNNRADGQYHMIVDRDDCESISRVLAGIDCDGKDLLVEAGITQPVIDAALEAINQAAMDKQGWLRDAFSFMRSGAPAETELTIS